MIWRVVDQLANGAYRLGARRLAVRLALWRMVREGFVERRADGRYQITDGNAEATGSEMAPSVSVPACVRRADTNAGSTTAEAVRW